MEKLKICLAWLRFLPVLPGVDWSDEKMCRDIRRWCEITHIQGSPATCLARLLFTYPEFRNLYLYRVGRRRLYRMWVRLFYKPVSTLFLEAASIGGGLYIHHGFATMVSAQSIGQDCWINQQVTIGYRDDTLPPILGDRVTVTCGAKVLGNITVGDGATIGANAVVIRDVEPGAVMVGVPAKNVSDQRLEHIQ